MFGESKVHLIHSDKFGIRRKCKVHMKYEEFKYILEKSQDFNIFIYIMFFLLMYLFESKQSICHKRSTLF